MRVLIGRTTALLLLAAAPAAYATPYCDALQKVGAGSAFGFATVRGPVDVAAHTSSFETYRARVALPGAMACSITVPHSPGLGPPAYACEFDGSLDVVRAMTRVARRTARCARVGIANPPRFRDGPEGPVYGFADAARRYDLSAARAVGKPGVWVVTLAITPGPHQPRRPHA